MTRVYLAGPMTGLPNYNYPAFHAAAKVLRDLGHQVLNPAENPAPACGTWQGYMRMALAQLVQCDCIVLLPGWAESRGARIERKLAQVLHIELADYNDIIPRALAPLMGALDTPNPTQTIDWSAA